MLKNIKLFANHTAYEAAKNNIDKPNVVMCQQEDEVHYNPHETKLVVYYDIQDISAPTTIFTNYDNSVKSIEVDNKETISEFSQGNVTYQFDAVGQHIIKFEFNDPTTVGNSAPLFYNLTTVKRVVIPNTFTAIGGYTFNGCSGLTSVTIPDSVTSIGDNAFLSCSSLTSVTIGTGVTNIGKSAFERCVGLTRVEIGNGVTTIGDYAFRYCNNLITAIIGDSVTSIGRQAFYTDENLASITFKSVTPPTLNYQSLDYTNNCPIYVPSASVEVYKAAWSSYASRIQAIS